MILGKKLAENLSLLSVLIHMPLHLAWHVSALIERCTHRIFFRQGATEGDSGPNMAAVVHLCALYNCCLDTNNVGVAYRNLDSLKFDTHRED